MIEARVQYEQMQLHDGESDAETDRLSELMAPVSNDRLNDWEGGDSGIVICMRVEVGDTIQVSKDGWVRVVRATRMPDMTFTEKDMA